MDDIKKYLDEQKKPYILITMNTNDITTKDISYTTVTNIKAPTFFQNILVDVLNGLRARGNKVDKNQK